MWNRPWAGTRTGTVGLSQLAQSKNHHGDTGCRIWMWTNFSPKQVSLLIHSPLRLASGSGVRPQVCCSLHENTVCWQVYLWEPVILFAIFGVVLTSVIQNTGSHSGTQRQVNTCTARRPTKAMNLIISKWNEWCYPKQSHRHLPVPLLAGWLRLVYTWSPTVFTST